MKKIFVIYLFLIGLNSFCQIPKLDWVNHIGGNTYSDIGMDITTDHSGNIFVTGFFRGTVDFDPGGGVFNLTSNGTEDIFIQKLDPLGNLIWAISIGGTSDDRGLKIEVDVLNNIYISGSFRNTVDFDPGAGVYNLTVTSYSITNTFTLKLDSIGNFLWAHKLETSSPCIKPDNSGNIYVAGTFSDTVDVDGGSGVLNLISKGSLDFFIQKLDNNGSIIWNKTIGGIGSDQISGLAIDRNENLLLTGHFSDTVDFNPGAGIFNLSITGLFSWNDIFVQKLDSAGTFLWAVGFGGDGSDNGLAICSDIFNNVYTTGRYANSGDFDPGPGVFTLTGSSNNDVFLQKLNSSGNLIWAKSIAGPNVDQGTAVATDSLGNPILVGNYYGFVDFDPGPGVFNMTSHGSSNYDDIFIQKLDTGGNFVWAYTIGGTGYDYCNSVEVDNLGGILLTGGFQQTVDFDPSTLNMYVTSSGWHDIFIKKLYECFPGTATDIQSACGSYTWLDGNTYTSDNNTAKYSYTNAATNGCDSILTLNLTISPTYLSNQNNSICPGDSLLIYGTYQNTAGIYYDSLQTVNGCDSILSTTLSVNQVFSSSQNQSICQGDSLLIYGTYQNTAGNYYDSLQTILGCDSILSVTLTINPIFSSNQNQSICQGDSALLGGVYQTVSGVYNDTLQSIIGCDSILTTTLSINPLPNVSLAMFNPDTLCDDGNLTVLPIGAPTGGTYAGSGVGGGNFDPIIAGIGNHEVIYTYSDGNNCSNSDTTIVTVKLCVGINEVNNDFGILIYPNPNTGLFTIEKPRDLNNKVNVKLLDATSKLILEKMIPVENQKVEMDIRNYTKGIYYLQLIVDDEIFVKQILKN